ncbi:uncharacterized protein A4U43_C08F33580 [Asparagus officinalis]|nr:uncharacterized protein A4U43_C08F33580 [Asparagus officinalis]
MGCVQARPSSPSGTSGRPRQDEAPERVRPRARAARPSRPQPTARTLTGPRKPMNIGTGVQRVRSAGVITEEEPPVAVEEAGRDGCPSGSLITFHRDYGVGVDLWSAGCLLAEMFAGRPIMPGKTEVEQLHRIFKLCGSPPEDFWRRLNLSASFRPPQPYRPLITEAFKDFPSCSLGLLKMLLALDPSCRGSASSALQNEFFGTSPLACDLSGLPVVCKKEDDESNQPHERRKRRSSKLKHQSRTQKETPTNVEQNMMKLEVGDYGRPVKAGARTTYSHELMRSSTGSTTSGMQPQRYSLSTPPALPPVKSPSFREHVVVRPAHSRELGGSSTTGSTSSSPPPIKPSSILEQRTEAHPAATKNVENGPINHRYGMEKRSASTSGFRRFDAKQIPGR